MPIQLQLIARKQLVVNQPLSLPAPRPGLKRLSVLHTAICRTDAKMWKSGHRDLVLPRVPGHEIAALDTSSGDLYTVWPGQSCGSCWFCLNGRENLCETMHIFGFHSDGGFASWIDVPKHSLIQAPPGMVAEILCFTEPVACVFNCLQALDVKAGERVIIYGGGVAGLLAALACRERGASCLVIEQSQEKLAKIEPFCRFTLVEARKESVESNFDIAINCCDSPIAFSLCVSKLAKGGRLGFFSGLVKNEGIDTNLLNLLHYRENRLIGSYGPRRRDMIEATDFCQHHDQALQLLIEERLSPDRVQNVLDDVGSGKMLKYIIDFQDIPAETATPATATLLRSTTARTCCSKAPSFLIDLLNSIHPVPEQYRERAQHTMDMKTKPLGALGKIEQLAVQISAIQRTLTPATDNNHLLVFAADHGIVEEGISAYPAKVTQQMVYNFLNGGAGVNAFCGHADIPLSIIDIGVNADFNDQHSLLHAKIRKGTRNFALEPAMTPEETFAAIRVGADKVNSIIHSANLDLLGLGEMGIGNTTSATAIISAITGIPAAAAAGRGTGVDNSGLQRKIEVINKALALHTLDANDPLGILVCLGGFEIAGIVGASLAAAANRITVVLDGLISTAAGLIAYQLCPAIADYLIAGHKSVEQGQQAALAHMGLKPVIDLDMRLGEGTGAAITMNLTKLAARVMREMATFAEAGVDQKT